ncbi:Sdc2p [Cichlidogyrus casuarinus]|uniref:Sdc2p n=1 Tax=Cichlidogyrus casuarinus TaxID=1844966 RepID=A0ABD2Q2N9_9PLAT
MDLPNSQGMQTFDDDSREGTKDYGYDNSWFSMRQLKELLKQPGVLAGIIGAAITIALLLALLIVFCVYRLRKRDEGSYSLDEPKKLLATPASEGGTSYARGANREFYA